MIRRPPRSTPNRTLFPYTTLFRSPLTAVRWRTLETIIPQLNPGQAAEFAGFVASLPPSLGAGNASSILAETWSRSDPVAASQFVASIENHTIQQAAVDAVADEWQATDPQATVEWLASLPPNRRLDGTVDAAVKRWVESDADAARQWAASVDDVAMRTSTATNLILTIGSSDLAGARAVLDEPWIPGESLPNLLSVVKSLTDSSPLFGSP